jgi:peptidoglycan/xylan/chitin deacetylase (PgdA/CDA1 family)
MSVRRFLRRPLTLSLTFDDGTVDHLDAARMLADRGVRATFYVNSGRLGSSSRDLDWSDLEQIAAYGHEIGGHTTDHVDLSETADDGAYEQILSDRRALQARGFGVASFAYPYGAWDDAARRLVATAGYASARRAWGLAWSGDRTHAVTERIPPVDRFAIRTVPSFEHDTSLDQLQHVVLDGELSGGWLPLVFHGVCDNGGRYDLSDVVFRGFVDWLRTRNRTTRIRTVGEVVGG